MFTFTAEPCPFMSRVQGTWKMPPIIAGFVSAVRDIRVLRDYSWT